MSFDAVRRELFKPKEPEVNFNFLVFVGAAPFGCFKSISEFSYTTPKKEFLAGGRLRGQEMAFDDSKGASWGHVTLKWGNSSVSTLQAWSQAVRVGGHFRREVFILQLSRSWEPTRVFHLHGAWPVKWTADGFDGDSGTTPWTVTGVELSFKTMNMVLPGLNLLRAGGLSIPNLGLGKLVADQPPEPDYIPLPDDDADDTEEDLIAAFTGSEEQRLADLGSQHDMVALARVPVSVLKPDELAALVEYRELKDGIATRNAARLDELSEELNALDKKVAVMASDLTQSGALKKPADELSDAEFVAVLEYQEAVTAQASAKVEKAALETGGSS